MNTSSDVNTIFAYVDVGHPFHMAVVIFLSKFQRQGYYVLLDEVKTVFIFTYSDYLKNSCLCIEKAIIDYKSKRKASSKLSPFAISVIIRSQIEKYLDKLSNEQNFDYTATKSFINKLLTEYPIPTLYNNEEKLAEFRENYLENAEKQAEKAINLFLKKFREFKVINISDMDNFDDWLDKIKKIDLKIFSNKQDMEDMRVAAQYVLCLDIEPNMGFATCDKEMYRSLQVLKDHYSLKTGKLVLLKKPK